MTIVLSSFMLRSLRRCRTSLSASRVLSQTMSTKAESTRDVQFSDSGCVTTITLNRPAALNSLTLDMIRLLYKKIKRYEKLSSVYSLIVQGAGGKAFCAGGDLKALYRDKMDNAGGTLREVFFKECYMLDHLIATLKTNYISILDGITMGGGVGLSVHGRFRIATENTVMAMPETAIGLFPDVGASWFLPRLEGELGMYLGLTGQALKGDDAVRAGLATHYVKSTDIEALCNRIHHVEYDPESVDYAIRERSEFDSSKTSWLTEAMPIINGCFSKKSVPDIITALKATGTEFADSTVKILRKRCPLSLKVTFKQLRQGRRMTLEQCFRMEYRIVQRMMEGKDFYEGIRSVVVEKDNSPKWQHESVEAVDNSIVDHYFSAAKDELLLRPA